jgi:Clr5 domain
MASDALISTPASGGRSGVPPTAEEWERHRSLFTRLYVGENATLKEVRQILARDHGFHATFVTTTKGSSVMFANFMQRTYVQKPYHTVGHLEE